MIRRPVRTAGYSPMAQRRCQKDGRTEQRSTRVGPYVVAADGYCGAPTPVSVAFNDEPSGSVTEPPLADNDPSRAR